jgi:hypothetical protein
MFSSTRQESLGLALFAVVLASTPNLAIADSLGKSARGTPGRLSS